MAELNRIVLTGAAGRLGSYLREPLTKLARELVATDIADDVGRRYPGERYEIADLASLDDMMRVLEGAAMVVHMGVYADEGPFEKLLGPNFVGAYNISEAAYRRGLKRVIHGSSIHAVGMHPKNNSSARTCRTDRTRSTGWPSVLLRIWGACTGINAGSRAFTCGSCPVLR